VTLDGQWRVELLARYAPDLEYRVAPLPPPAGGRPRAGTGGGNFMIIPRGARQVGGAWEFIKFWSGLEQPERAAEFYLWGGWLPLSPAVARAPVYQAYLRQYPQFRTFLEIMMSENVQSPPPVAYQLYLEDRVTWTEEMAARGALTPAQALARLERDVGRERERRRELGYRE
jgi:multiple sugar transport system substrate-binding protein